VLSTNGGLALTGIVYAAFSYLQWCANKKAAEAAKFAAETAHDALVDSQKYFELQNRPYVITAGRATFVQDKPGHNILTAANIDYKNIGKTPAQDVVITSYFAPLRPGITKKNWPEIVNMFEDAYKTIPGREAEIFKSGVQPQETDIAPDAPPGFSTQELTGQLSKADELGLKSGSVILVYLGRFYYKGFEHKKSYSTDFCFYFYGPDPTVWHYCPIHNTLN
jgi:hypothetical protein